MNVETARAQMLGQELRARKVLDQRVLDVVRQVRGVRVAEYLAASGYARVFNLTGGIDACSLENDSSVPRFRYRISTSTIRPQ